MGISPRSRRPLAVRDEMHAASDWRCTYNFMNHHTSDVTYRESQPTTHSAYAAANSPRAKGQSCATSDSAGKAKYSAARDMPPSVHCPIGCPLCNICRISIGSSNLRVDRDMACARADDNGMKEETHGAQFCSEPPHSDDGYVYDCAGS